MNCPEKTVHETIGLGTVSIDDNGADGFNDKDSDSEYEDASSSLDTELEDGEIIDECYQQEPSSDMRREAPSTILRYVTMDPPKQPNASLYRHASLHARPQRLTDLRPRPPSTLRYTTTHSRSTAHYGLPPYHQWYRQAQFIHSISARSYHRPRTATRTQRN